MHAAMHFRYILVSEALPGYQRSSARFQGNKRLLSNESVRIPVWCSAQGEPNETARSISDSYRTLLLRHLRYMASAETSSDTAYHTRSLLQHLVRNGQTYWFGYNPLDRHSATHCWN